MILVELTIREENIMALSNAQIRAIAIKRSIARKAQPTAANDNSSSPRVRGGSRMMTTAMLSACLEASGHAEHAAC